jgi:hypothetical protein
MPLSIVRFLFLSRLGPGFKANILTLLCSREALWVFRNTNEFANKAKFVSIEKGGLLSLFFKKNTDLSLLKKERLLGLK